MNVANFVDIRDFADMKNKFVDANQRQMLETCNRALYSLIYINKLISE